MGSVKRVLLGSAAGVFAVAGAQAADLAVKAKPVEYVKVCSLYGAGFWYVPGTDTCIKIGAYTQGQVAWNLNGNGSPVGFGTGSNTGNPSGRQDRTDTGNLSFRNRDAISFDMRTQTEYGTLRSYIDVGTDINVSSITGGSNTGAVGAQTIFASRAFIQFAGFTVGRIRSFFDMFNNANYTYTGGQTHGDTSANGLFGLAYTWQFGGGLSATLSAEDGGFATGGRGRTTVNAATTGGPISFSADTVTPDVKGQTVLDPVLNVRLDQAWGFVGVSGALHDASGGYYGATNSTVNGHPDDKFGWAFAGSALFNNPFGLSGDSVGFIAAFSRGAAGYATGNGGIKQVFGSGNNVGFGVITDGIYATNGQIQLTDVWSVTGAYEHLWNPMWRTSVYGGLVGVSYNDQAKTSLCTGGISGVTFANCDPNFSYSVVGTRTQWNPHPDLLVGLDLSWWHLNTGFAGAATLTAPAGARPSGAYTVSDQDVFSALFRVQRSFLY
jgi:hypothetical protein